MLTHKQRKAFLYISQTLDQEGVAPSYEEIGQFMGLKSRSGAHRLVNVLVEKGYLRTLPGRARSIEVTHYSDAFPQHRSVSSDFSDKVKVPFYGKVAAGNPYEMFEHVEFIEIPSYLARGSSKDLFVLKVVGDSMKYAGILDQDYVVLERCTSAPLLSIVAAIIDGSEVTLKRLISYAETVILKPENPDFVTQEFEKSRVSIQGRLLGLLRHY